MLSLGGGVLLYLFRTENGRLDQCRSRDDGRSWESGLHASYAQRSKSQSKRWLKQPRGPLTARRLRDGSFLLLFFNNGWKGYSPPQNNTRNPYFLSRGQVTAGGPSRMPIY